MLAMTNSTASRVVLVPVPPAAGAAPIAAPVRRYRLARLGPPPLPKGLEHLRRSYD